MTDHRPGDLEERIRDAYRSAAQTVPTLQQPAPMRTAGSVARPHQRNAFAPVAAAIAVLVVIGASVAVPRAAERREPGRPGDQRARVRA